CDQLYKIKPISSWKMIEPLLFDDLRIDEDGFEDMNKADIRELSEKYRCRNIDYLVKYIG
ncbi:MAG: hypothetical protein MJZ68_07485, partial [archaeon]|nr:hypothetical protein [archaeon]